MVGMGEITPVTEAKVVEYADRDKSHTKHHDRLVCDLL